LAGRYDFTIYKGTDWRAALTWRADDELVDLTDWHAHMQIRPDYADKTTVVYADLTDGDHSDYNSGGITLGGTDGTILLHQSAVQTSAMAFSSAVYDLKLTDSAGRLTRLLEGIVILSDEVTRG
jgi:hypothetical protein